jgi:hypothetical protein
MVRLRNEGLVNVISEKGELNWMDTIEQECGDKRDLVEHKREEIDNL